MYTDKYPSDRKKGDLHIVTGNRVSIDTKEITGIVPMKSISYGIITDNGINLRRKPDLDSDILGQMYHGEKVVIVEKLSGWHDIASNNSM